MAARSRSVLATNCPDPHQPSTPQPIQARDPELVRVLGVRWTGALCGLSWALGRRGRGRWLGQGVVDGES